MVHIRLAKGAWQLGQNRGKVRLIEPCSGLGAPAGCTMALLAVSSWEDETVPSVEERVIEIVSENLGVNKEQVTRSTAFIEDLGADSLDIVELVMELEEEFEITIPDEQAEKIKTVGEAIDYIQREIDKK